MTNTTTAVCSFANSGTYGHECGDVAVLVAVKVSKPSAGIYPPRVTKTGLYFSPRCAECARIKGGENGDVIRFEKFDADKHQNEWVNA